MTPIKIKTCLILTLIILPVYSYGLNGNISSSVGVNSVYTDNLNLTGQENKTDDLITYIQPGLSSVFETMGTQTALSYGGNYSYYKKHDDNNTLGHTGRFNHVNRFTRFSTLTLSDVYNETESLRSDLGQVTDIRSSRQKYTTNNAAMDYRYQFGQNDTINSALHYSTLENEDRSLNDNQSYAGSVNIEYQLDSHVFSSAGITSTHTEYTAVPGIIKSYDNNNIEFTGKIEKDLNRFTNLFVNYDHIYMHYLEGNSGDYHIFDPSVGLKHTWSESSHIALGIGWLYERNEKASNDSRFHATIDLNKQWLFKNAQCSLSATNGYEQTYRNADNNGINYYYQTTGAASYELTRNITYSADVSYRYDMYEMPGVSNEDRKDNAIDVTTGIHWQLTDILTASAGYEFHLRNSDDNSNDYKENRAKLTINLKYWDQRL